MPNAYFIVDAFTAEPFAGNAAAVVLDAHEWGDARMAAVAGEFNLSETTFVLPATQPHADVRFRWFTPAVEVDMCGHATVAGVHALLEAGRFRRVAGGTTQLKVETRSGVLDVFVEESPEMPGGPMIWIQMPTPRVEPIHLLKEELTEGLGTPLDTILLDRPFLRTQENDAIVFVRDTPALFAMRPDFGLLGKMCRRLRLRGLCVATTNTLAPSIHVQSRFFAPASGIDEDPVTGSVHGPLAMYVAHSGGAPMINGVAGLRCVQAKAGGRSGVIYALVEGPADACSVRIGGQAVTTMRGELVR
jgi:PhzF family phenazine biosynthesis protein